MLRVTSSLATRSTWPWTAARETTVEAPVINWRLFSLWQTQLACLRHDNVIFITLVVACCHMSVCLSAEFSLSSTPSRHADHPRRLTSHSMIPHVKSLPCSHIIISAHVLTRRRMYRSKAFCVSSGTGKTYNGARHLSLLSCSRRQWSQLTFFKVT